MTQQRLLMFFSYIGTNYKGIQRTVGRNVKGPNLESVQGIIEFGLNKVLRRENSAIVISSRTDSGVHAIQSTAHFDNAEPVCLNPTRLCQSMNLYLEKNQTDIRIKRIVEVPPTFHCRFQAISRSYCYRIALLRNNDFDNCLNLNYLSGALPVTEVYRCEPVPQPLKLEKIFDASKLFLGTWNFLTFSKPSKDDKDADEEDFIKTILSISFGKVNNSDIAPSIDWETYQRFNFYEFHVEGSGFLRRQVRKMVGALLAIGKEIITEQDLKYMLENPSQKNWNNKCAMGSCHGLFLKSVNYHDVPVLRW